jgi:hypothetical protein
MKHFDNVDCSSLSVGAWCLMIIKNYKYIGFEACRTDKRSVCCIEELQHGAKVIWQLLHRISRAFGVCLQIAGNWVWSPNKVTNFMLKGDNLEFWLDCAIRFCTAHSNVFIIIDIASIIMTFAWATYSMTFCEFWSGAT